MAVIDVPELKEEMVVFLRNQDVLTVTERGVTTTSDTGTFAGETTYTINKTNVKNIRSIVVAAATVTFGSGYTVEYDYDDSGTKKCRITFSGAQTGAYTITYDYGTDAIFPDYPRLDLSISSYPRIAVIILSSDSKEAAIGGASIITNISLSIIVYAASEKRTDAICKLIRAALIANKKAFYNVKFITPIGFGPMLKSPDRSDKIVQRNIDCMSPLNYEE